MSETGEPQCTAALKGKWGDGVERKANHPVGDGFCGSNNGEMLGEGDRLLRFIVDTDSGMLFYPTKISISSASLMSFFEVPLFQRHIA